MSNFWLCLEIVSSFKIFDFVVLAEKEVISVNCSLRSLAFLETNCLWWEFGAGIRTYQVMLAIAAGLQAFQEFWISTQKLQPEINAAQVKQYWIVTLAAMLKRSYAASKEQSQQRITETNAGFKSCP